MSGVIAEVLKKRGIICQTDIPAATLCTFRIGGSVAALVTPQCLGELIRAVAVCHEEKLPYAVIGRGSNILFGDGPIEVVLICTGALDAIRVLPDGRLYVLCGTSLAALCRQAAKVGYSGLEFAAGIPGSVGGGVKMNAGAYGRSLSDVVETALVLDVYKGQLKTLFNNELNFSYRNSKIQDETQILLAATLALKTDVPPVEIFKNMNELAKRRRATQPLEFPSAGSTFKRPTPGYPLSAELDRLGLKGLTVGGAMVSPKHAGFIVNTGSATAADVRALIFQIQTITERELGVRPIPEIRLIPEDV